MSISFDSIGQQCVNAMVSGMPVAGTVCKFNNNNLIPHCANGDAIHGFVENIHGKNATVTVCHTKTVDVAGIARKADILVSAAGVLNSLTKDYVSEGQIVIDVSINWDPEKINSKGGKGAIAGDAVFSEVEPIVGAITPVPGGVGSVTTSVLIGHVVEAAERTL